MLNLESIKKKQGKEQSDPVKNNEAFVVKPASQWMREASTRPKQKKLFGSLFFEHEFCIAFSASNVGKSILSVQIGDLISRGDSIYPLDNETPPQKLLYFDFEMSDMQFFDRYSDANGWKQFSDNFLRVEMTDDYDIPTAFKSEESFLLWKIEETIQKTGAKVVIIDNITYIAEDNEKGTKAKELMKALKQMKKRLKISMLIIAHTPKKDAFTALEPKNLAGSTHLMNFADSVFAIGLGRNNERYIKQLKCRNGKINYGYDNVLTFDVEKDNEYLRFTFGEYSSETTLLSELGGIDVKAVMSAHDSGSTISEIAGIFNTYYNKIKRIIDKEEKKREEQAKQAEEFQKFADNAARDEPLPF